MAKTHYEILNVSMDAKAAKIKRAYNKLVLKTHPDKGGDSTLFMLVQAAKDVLLDPKKRQEYDRELNMNMDSSKNKERIEQFVKMSPTKKRGYLVNLSYDDCNQMVELLHHSIENNAFTHEDELGVLGAIREVDELYDCAEKFMDAIDDSDRDEFMQELSDEEKEEFKTVFEHYSEHELEKLIDEYENSGLSDTEVDENIEQARLMRGDYINQIDKAMKGKGSDEDKENTIVPNSPYSG